MIPRGRSEAREENPRAPPTYTISDLCRHYQRNILFDNGALIFLIRPASESIFVSPG